VYCAINTSIAIAKIELIITDTGTLKSRDLTTRDWTTRHQIATVDIAGVDNAAQGSGVREQSSAGRLIAAE